MMKLVLFVALFTALLFEISLKTEATFSVSSCSLTCGEEMGNPRVPPTSSQVWRPGKAGPRGPKGEPGSKGEEGRRGTDCDCRNQTEMYKELTELRITVDKIGKQMGKDCYTRKLFGYESGVHVIYPNSQFKEGIEVICNQDVKGGGWIVIQRRSNGSVDFLRNWDQYVAGFGSNAGEMWLGLELIHKLTTSGHHELLVDLEDWDGNRAWAKYGKFSISGAVDNYRLAVEHYSGTAGDGLSNQNGQQFSTNDKDNDKYRKNCAVMFKGAWWYNKCHKSNLNGLYTGTKENADGMSWYPWGNTHRSLKSASMMIRPSLV